MRCTGADAMHNNLALWHDLCCLHLRTWNSCPLLRTLAPHDCGDVTLKRSIPQLLACGAPACHVEPLAFEL